MFPSTCTRVHVNILTSVGAVLSRESCSILVSHASVCRDFHVENTPALTQAAASEERSDWSRSSICQAGEAVDPL